MSLKNYGVLKGRIIGKMMASSQNEHFQVLVDDGDIKHRIAINVKSQVNPPEVLFYMSHDYKHEITDAIKNGNIAMGFTALDSRPGGIAIDFIRRNMFDHNEMQPIPYNVPGADNDINEKLDFYVSQAMNDAEAVVYAWGEKWGPENNVPDKYFHFEPGNGIHDIHMNQGNSGQYKKDNGVWQDGALMIHFAARDQWVAVFIAFQVQTFYTDNVTGDPLPAPIPEPPPTPTPTPEPEPQPQPIPTKAIVRIIAAKVNPEGDDVGKEYIILLNKTSKDIDLTGWVIMDKSQVNHDTIAGKIIPAGDALKITLTGRGAQLSNKGGLITLYDPHGIKIDGVSYTKAEADTQDELLEL